MTEVMPNFGRLAKLLEMTTSDHDGEAVTAIHRANEERDRLGLSWTELLVERSPVPQDASDTAPGRPSTRRRTPPRTACWTAPNGARWEAVFQAVYDHVSLSDHWVDILGSIQGYYIQRGWPRGKQIGLRWWLLATAQEREAA